MVLRNRSRSGGSDFFGLQGLSAKNRELNRPFLGQSFGWPRRSAALKLARENWSQGMTKFTFLSFSPAAAWRAQGSATRGAACSPTTSTRRRFRPTKPTGRTRHQARRRRELTLADLPAAAVDLAWASFPCQDLSLAGGYRGLGRERDKAPTRSGTFWPFWQLIRGLVLVDRAPRTIMLENVYGCLTSHGGKDFAAIASALADSGYRFGAAVINASHFVPQSRPRVFFVAVRKGEEIPGSLIARGPPGRHGIRPR